VIGECDEGDAALRRFVHQVRGSERAVGAVSGDGIHQPGRHPSVSLFDRRLPRHDIALDGEETVLEVLAAVMCGRDSRPMR
jgi:hypothetical protein